MHTNPLPRRVTRPIAVVVLLLVALAVCASAALALARPASGTYTGTTSDGRSAKLNVHPGGKRVTYRLLFATVTGSKCTPSNAYLNAGFVSSNPGKSAKIGAKNGFNDPLGGSKPGAQNTTIHYGGHVSGKFAANGTASGHVLLKARFTHKGSKKTIARCSTKFSWSVKHG